METLDLDIENYDLDDILNLFKLNYQFDEYELKQSYKIVLKTHPDKSGLKKEVFLFFKQAYSILKKIYYFRNRKQECAHTQNYVIEKNKEHEELLRKLDGKSVKDFNKWFNNMFEQNKVSDEDFDKGYGDWYTNSEVEQIEKVSSLRDFGRVFENKKKECKSLVVRSGVSEMQSNNNGYNLSREAPSEYSSDLFSKLKYEDLKKAHTETVVPVTREDYENKKKFNSVDSYRRYRSQQNTNAPSLEQSKILLQKKQE
ncbi:MAG: hypothetical protein OXF62_17985, partial [Caldilineaceae bacterium]|nr:hypothetical protein [Caldilineaceae bacterium]